MTTYDIPRDDVLMAEYKQFTKGRTILHGAP